MDRLRFRSLASGSSGNCYFIGNSSYGILIDAGVGVRSIRRFLRTMGLDFQHIWGVFVTHDHTDHIKAVGVLGEKHNIPVYTTRKIHEGINRNYCVTQKLSGSQRFIEIGDTIEIGDILIKSFPVSHDASESVGFSVNYKGKTAVFATDLGYICESATKHLSEADYLILEANYDDEMLANGPYPYYLQKRIKADTGHLSNMQTAMFLAENFTERWKYIFLCHLSKENNLPEIAYNTIKEHFRNNLIDTEEKLQIIPLERISPSPLYIFD
ncbi:Metallo-beta-lactamase superfamily hydrolase [uncultured Paludibacter sp.]|uniref:Metallo-beta-lactamase superfamily hydrolase n=1 Tax=uncultured Paludibacter sp. TaxID=497635 RepID=A0A653A6H6_9BACT|nr:Metallo-beta-lactamase superfamily hydrolase [uncultured Paludibacter sp.]